jgi:isopenicillin N synthase-like dioxygenase
MTQIDFASAKTISSDDIPVIDISRAVDGSDIEAVANEIYAAATGTGFFYISNHGIDPALMAQAFRVSSDFFEQPVSSKETIAVNTDQRGWMATGMSRLQGSNTHDLKEVFFWGTEVAHDDPDLLAKRPLVAQNQWPNEAFPRLQAELAPYYDALCEVARKVLAAIAVSLDQPADFFESRYQMPLARGQLVYYPTSGAEDEAEQRFGVAPHTDFGVLTFLLQDNNGGLQVRLKSGEWAEAPPIENTLVCNIGDLLQRWSNDRFQSTVHRVINRSGNARYSIPVFFDPHTDTIVDPCDLGVSVEDRKHDPIGAGEYIVGRNQKSFSQFKK